MVEAVGLTSWLGDIIAENQGTGVEPDQASRPEGEPEVS